MESNTHQASTCAGSSHQRDKEELSTATITNNPNEEEAILFSPRSAAAMALSSFSSQHHRPQIRHQQQASLSSAEPQAQVNNSSHQHCRPPPPPHQHQIPMHHEDQPAAVPWQHHHHHHNPEQHAPAVLSHRSNHHHRLFIDHNTRRYILHQKRQRALLKHYRRPDLQPQDISYNNHHVALTNPSLLPSLIHHEHHAAAAAVQQPSIVRLPPCINRRRLYHHQYDYPPMLLPATATTAPNHYDDHDDDHARTKVKKKPRTITHEEEEEQKHESQQVHMDASYMVQLKSKHATQGKICDDQLRPQSPRFRGQHQLQVQTQPHSESEENIAYSRKKKSLGMLTLAFCQRYQNCTTPSSNDNTDNKIVIDHLSRELQVERRRIYDVVNILESICVVTKKAKNTYCWMGTDHLPQVLARLQQQAIRKSPQDALGNGLLQVLSPASSRAASSNHLVLVPNTASTTSMALANNNTTLNKTTPPGFNNHVATTRSSSLPPSSCQMLCRLSQQFLQVFLIGFTTTSLPEASDWIHGASSTTQDLAVLGLKSASTMSNLPTCPKLLAQAAARGLKTKIRRLYDIANVLSAIGLLKKADYNLLRRDVAAADTKRKQQKPVYIWVYPYSPRDLLNLARSNNNESSANKLPPLAPSLPPVSSMEQPHTGESETTLLTTSESMIVYHPPTLPRVSIPADDPLV